jgi:hypothetical protein
MTVPFPLSDAFSEYIQSLEDRIEELRRTLDQTTADLGYLGDRLAFSANISSVTLPCEIVSGDNEVITCSFGPSNRRFALEQYFGIEGDIDRLPDWLKVAPEFFQVSNALAAAVAPDFPLIFHGLDSEPPEGTITAVDLQPSGCLVTFYIDDGSDTFSAPNVREAWTYDSADGEAPVYAVTYVKPDVKVECAE